MALAVIGILYGALVAWVQEDMKKLVAYSSIAHLGFVMLGLLAFDLIAWEGSLLQMVNHGLSTGALFLLVGMLYDRRHTKKFAEFGGLAKVMPVFAFFLVFSALASVGLPALNGFVGEFLILAGSYRALRLAGGRWPPFGVVLAAIYLLKMLQLTLWGPITKEENRGPARSRLREIAALVPLCVFMLWIGVAPETLPEAEPAGARRDADRVPTQGSERPAVAEVTASHPTAPEAANPIAEHGGGTMSRARPDQPPAGDDPLPARGSCSCCSTPSRRPAPGLHRLIA